MASKLNSNIKVRPESLKGTQDLKSSVVIAK